MKQELEKAWYYYLADIAARWILQRVIDTFYAEPEVSLLNIAEQDLVDTAAELDRQLTRW